MATPRAVAIGSCMEAAKETPTAVAMETSTAVGSCMEVEMVKPTAVATG